MDKDVKKKRIILWYTAVACLAICLYGAIFLSPLNITLHTSSLRPYCYYFPIVAGSVILLVSLFKGKRQSKNICRFALLSLVILAIAPVFLHLLLFLDNVLNEYNIGGFLFLIWKELPFVSLVPAVISVSRICFRKQKMAGLWFSVAVICFVGSERIAPEVISYYDNTHPSPGRVCSTNLKGLSIALEVYSFDYDGKVPTPSKWCDLLKVYADVNAERFSCPLDKKGPCSYAMNESASHVFDKSEEEEIVLIFESKPGWNQVGGAELFNTDNHDGEGGMVVLSNGMVKFIKTEELPKLKWKQNSDANKKAVSH